MTAQTSEEDAAAEPAEVAVDDKQATPPESVPRSRRAAHIAGIGICGAALAALGFFGWHYAQHRAVSAAGEAALNSARSYAEALTSIDSASVDDSFAGVIDGATGGFKDSYSQSAAQLRQVLIDNKAMSKGIVLDAAVKSATRNKVEVLLFVDQAITNVANPSARIDRSRVAMTMERIGGRWLASRVELK